MLPDDLARIARTRSLALEIMGCVAPCWRHAQPERTEVHALPDPAALLSRYQHRDDQLAVPLGHEDGRAAGYKLPLASFSSTSMTTWV